MRITTCLLTLAATLSAAGPVAAAVVIPGMPGRNTVRITAQTVASATSIASGAGARPAVIDGGTEERVFATVGTFSISRNGEAFDQSAAGFARATSSSTAEVNFVDAATATLRFSGNSSANSQAADGAARTFGAQSFQYFFSVTTNSVFDLSYAFSAQTLGCCGNRIELRDFTTPGVPIGQTIFGTATSGRLTTALTAGSFYGLSISKGQYEAVDSASVRGMRSQAFTFNDTIRFSITDPNAVAAVPEPATWATMILGLAVVGAAARRRRGAAVPA